MAKLETILDKKKEELLNKIPMFQPNFSKYTDIRESMDQLVWSWLYKPYDDGPAAPLAYATRDGKVNASYKIYVYRDYYPAIQPMEMHEEGHCIFQHLKYEKGKFNTVKDLFSKKWNSIKESIDFEDDDDEDYEISVSDAALHSMINVAMDMEVNSKVFPGAERAEAFKIMSYSFMTKAIKNAKNIAELQPIEDFLTGKSTEPIVKFIDPVDYNFPEGLNWMAYITLILSDEEKMKQALKDAIDNAKNGKGNGQQQQPGNGSENGDADGDGDPAEMEDDGKGNKQRKIPASAIKDAAESNDVASENTGKLGEEVKESEAKEAGAVFNHKFGKEYNGNSGHGYATQEIIDERNKGIRNFVLEKCVAKFAKNNRDDILYYYNRGRCTDVLMNRRTSSIIRRPRDIYVVVDVSGSVNIDVVNVAINELLKNRNHFGKKSRIITCDWDVSADMDLSSNSLKKIVGGGSTRIAAGIEYAYNNYLKKSKNKDDVLFIISDFEDNLNQWDDVLVNIKNPVYAINWDSRSKVNMKHLPNNNIYYPKDIEY